MPITYREFKNDVADYMNRSDLESKLDTFVRLAEKNIYKKLRAQQMERNAFALVEEEIDFVYVPDACLEFMRRPAQVNKVPYRYVERSNNAQEDGTFTRIYNKLYFYPALEIGDEIDIYFWRDPSGRLVNDDDSFEELEDFYAAYLYGACVEASIYIKDDKELEKYKALLEAEINNLNRYAKQYNQGHVSTKRQRIRL